RQAAQSARPRISAFADIARGWSRNSTRDRGRRPHMTGVGLLVGSCENPFSHASPPASHPVSVQDRAITASHPRSSPLRLACQGISVIAFCAAPGLAGPVAPPNDRDIIPVGSLRVQVDFQVAADAGPTTRVELWDTTDAGRSWRAVALESG